MNRWINMNTDLFDKWADILIIKSYDWKQIGISNEYCNQISEPEFGLRVFDWSSRLFEVVDEQKYIFFLLSYS